ncbi:hypothetical protein [Microbacterium sp. MYb62]|uniref:hypothetical protein n=1 Tax=Microbacterium sp. MYb62 TaxID=1848690 RepID=UPI000CFCFDDF|nr:hypothetical protein [Microbacterium sp. MYb62]PRB13492.1 hypothetical protein CQ042_13635 [Microbacterium sp. MYb62]
MKTRASGLVDVFIVGGEVVVRPRRMWKVWSLCREKRLPREAILSAHVSSQPGHEVPARFRAPGLATLGSLAGYMRGPKGRSWWCYRHGESAVVLNVAHPKLAYVVFIADDNDATVAALQRTAHRP